MERNIGSRHPNYERVRGLLETCIAAKTPPPTYSEIGLEHRMNRDTVYQLVKREGLREELTELRKAPAVFIHSRRNARFLGMLVGTAGSVDPSRREIAFVSPDSSAAASFREISKGFFRDDELSRRRVYENLLPGGSTKIHFISQTHIVALGDFRKEQVADTVKKRHKWVLERQYVANFVSGVLDSGGIIDLEGPKENVTFYTTNKRVALLFRTMLQEIGIKNPRIKIDRYKKQGIKGVQISDIGDLQLFGRLVKSVNPQIQTQEQLDALIQLEPRQRTKSPPASEEEIFAAWKKITERYGPNVSENKIARLKARGETPYSAMVYRYRFGGEKRNYRLARRTLNELTSETDNATTIFP